MYTNVVIDFLCAREGFFDDAKLVFEYCFSDVDGVIAGHTVSNLFYILQKHYHFTLEQCRTKIKNLCTLFEVADISKDVVLAALENEDFTDLEDSLQNECAIHSAVDYIVTCNRDDFAGSEIPVVTPKAFIGIARGK